MFDVFGLTFVCMKHLFCVAQACIDNVKRNKKQKKKKRTEINCTDVKGKKAECEIKQDKISMTKIKDGCFKMFQ